MSFETWKLFQKLDRSTLDSILIAHCAPVIANLKVSNLLEINKNQLGKLLKYLKGRSIHCYILFEENDRLIILLYREKKIKGLLKNSTYREIFINAGYPNTEVSSVLFNLKERYKDFKNGNADFPHEMGLLLGYPLEDVKGFVIHKGKNCLCNGYWKVYENASEKKRIFEAYSNAQNELCKMLCQGRKMPEILDFYDNKKIAVNAALL